MMTTSLASVHVPAFGQYVMSSRIGGKMRACEQQQPILISKLALVNYQVALVFLEKLFKNTRNELLKAPTSDMKRSSFGMAAARETAKVIETLIIVRIARVCM